MSAGASTRITTSFLSCDLGRLRGRYLVLRSSKRQVTLAVPSNRRRPRGQRAALQRACAAPHQETTRGAGEAHGAALPGASSASAYRRAQAAAGPAHRWQQGLPEVFRRHATVA